MTTDKDVEVRLRVKVTTVVTLMAHDVSEQNIANEVLENIKAMVGDGYYEFIHSWRIEEVQGENWSVEEARPLTP
jgi:hypothetical protein